MPASVGALRLAGCGAVAVPPVERQQSLGLRDVADVRERGSNFSAGQRQLLSLARVLVFQPEILVMDEATSSVDTETELLIETSGRRTTTLSNGVVSTLVEGPDPRWGMLVPLIASLDVSVPGEDQVDRRGPARALRLV